MAVDEDWRGTPDPLRLWSGVRTRWLAAGLDRLTDAFERKFSPLAERHDSDQIGVMLHWLEALSEEDPVCTLAVVDNLATLLSHVDPEGLGRWILTGLRMHPGNPKSQQAYFQMEDPRAIETLYSEAGADELATAIPSLELLLNGLSGRRLQLQPRRRSELTGLPLRPVLASEHLLLPDDYTALDGLDRYRIYRAAVAHAVAHLRYSTPSLPGLTLKPMGIAVVSAIEDARVERLLIRDYPGVQAWFLEFLKRGVQPHGLDFSALLGRMNLALMDKHYQDDNYWVNKARRLFEAQAVDLHNYAEFRALASILANDLGQMRVPFRAQRYVVPEAYRDDNSFLWNFINANDTPPKPLELQVQNPDRKRQTPELATLPDAPSAEKTAKETELGRYTYPEWDRRTARMRADWCTVIEKLPVRQDRIVMPDQKKSGITRISPVPLLRSRQLSRIRRLRRQWEGEDIDLNAAIEIIVDQRMGLSPDPRVFVRAGREEQVSSVLVLLDLSESTNDRVGNRMESILDIEKKAVLLLAQSVILAGDRIAVHGFSSNTRAEVSYFRLLEFDAPLDLNTTLMIRSASGSCSTRIGAALRHATTCLAHEPTTHQAILLITDGAPSDVDVFEPRYLIEDARAAVHEGRRSGVQFFCVALDPKADPYVRTIFGWNNYRITNDPDSLPGHLSALYARLVVK
ncbi:MAG: VWA domain-containing protein [Burkholderiales bacterium]